MAVFYRNILQHFMSLTAPSYGAVSLRRCISSNEGRILYQSNNPKAPSTTATGATLSTSGDGTSTPTAETTDEKKEEKKGWFSRLLTSKSEQSSAHESHSSLLADKETVYEIQFHSVKPEYMDTYLKEFKTFMDLIATMNTGAELVGSWTVEVGDLDEAVHLWKFAGGYPVLNDHKYILRTNEEFLKFRSKRNSMLRSRTNQILLAFGFWKDILPRTTANIYELRSYVLTPGTMMEWGSNWARGLKYRQAQNESVAGFFSNIGKLYHAHHLWAYKSLQARQEVREDAWLKPGWDELVANTVPLIKETTSRILIPTSFSPLK